MKRLLLLVFLPLAICYGAERNQVTHEEVSADNTEFLPVPPQQQSEWHMPTSMTDPQGLLSSFVDQLFKAGMADPRGLPYHHVSVMEDGKLVPARGWVLPADQNQRYAIGWCGMIYPVAEVGELADLNADLETLRAKGGFYERRYYSYEENWISYIIEKFEGGPRMMHPFAAPFILLRLGYPIMLVDKNSSPFAEDDGKAHEWYLHDNDYEALADFARITRDDGVAAWIDGDYPLAAERLKYFDAIWQAAQKRYLREEVQADLQNDPIDPFAGGYPRMIELNSSWRDLLVDSKRRLIPTPVVEGSIIEQAIASWDQIDEFTKENPPPLYRLVASSGPMAIKPLLDCLTHDKRWTGVVKEDDENRWEPKIMRVRDLAILALNEVLEFSFEEMPGGTRQTESEWYDEAATKYQQLCARYEYQWGHELWYRILNDPQSELGYQLLAAHLIVTPDSELSNPYYHGFESVSGGAYCESFETIKPSDVLRKRENPSVLELMKCAWQRECKQVDEALDKGAQEVIPTYFCGGTDAVLRSQAQNLVHYMEDWSPGNVDILHSHYRWLREGLAKEWKKENSRDYYLVKMCEDTLIRRFIAGDETAITDYIELFHASMPHGSLPMQFPQLAPASPELDKLVAEAFLGENAPLNFTHKPWEKYESRENYIAWNTPLLRFPSYRKALIEALQCTTVQATLLLTPEKAEILFHANRAEEPELLYDEEGLLPNRTTNSEVEVRVCDLIAYHFMPGIIHLGVGFQPWNLNASETSWLAPDFHLDDPLEQRDKAIAEWIERLEAYH